MINMQHVLHTIFYTSSDAWSFCGEIFSDFSKVNIRMLFFMLLLLQDELLLNKNHVKCKYEI